MGLWQTLQDVNSSNRTNKRVSRWRMASKLSKQKGLVKLDVIKYNFGNGTNTLIIDKHGRWVSSVC